MGDSDGGRRKLGAGCRQNIEIDLYPLSTE